MLEDRLHAALRSNAEVAARLSELETEVRNGEKTPALAVDEIATMMKT